MRPSQFHLRGRPAAMRHDRTVCARRNYERAYVSRACEAMPCPDPQAPRRRQSVAAGFQSQIGGLQSQIIDNNGEARRGIAAAVATASAPMPSMPGKTTWQARASTGWRDPVDGTICYIYLPITAAHSPPTASGYVQYGPNTVGSMSCLAAAPVAAARGAGGPPATTSRPGAGTATPPPRPSPASRPAPAPATPDAPPPSR